MHAWLCEELTGAQALRWTEMPTPEPMAGEVRIAVYAANLNFPDLLAVQGKYQARTKLPFVLGSEFSGVVEAVGGNVGHLVVGDRVASIGTAGGFGTHACVSAATVLLWRRSSISPTQRRSHSPMALRTMRSSTAPH